MPKSQNTYTTAYILDGNIKSLCRVCLTQSPKMFKLTDNLNTDEYAVETYVEALEKVTSVKVELDIDYPLGICPMCISLLKITLQFVTQFVKSQEKIHDMLGEDDQEYENIKLEIHTDDDFDEEQEQEYENGSDEDTNVEIISLNVEDPVPKSDLIENIKNEENENIVVNDEVSILDVRNCDESDEASEYQLNKIVSDGNDNVEYIVESIEQFENDVYSRESDENTGDLNSSIENLVDQANGDCDVDSNKSEPLSHIEYIEIINNDTDKEKLPESDYEKPVPRRRGRKRKRKVDDDIKDELVKEMKFPCEVCKKVYQSKLSLKSHQNRVHREHLFKVFRCDLCGENCRTSSALTNHKLKHFEKQFKCGVCDKAYTTKAHLKVHIAAHENNRPFLCNVCGKGFNYANALSYHMRLHTGEKNYHCEYCPKTFRMVNSLNRHLRTHTGEKPYKCQYCGRDFSSRGEVVCHEYIHTGYRPYHCKYCKKGFSKTHNLKIHLLSHNGPYQCWFCTKSFIEENILAMHLKISHKSLLSEEEQHEGTTTTDFDEDSQEASEYMDVNFKEEEMDEELQ